MKKNPSQLLTTPTRDHNDALVMELLSDIPRGDCLDIGCGTGEFAVVLHSKGFKVHGIDVQDYAVEVSRQRCKEYGIRIEKCSAFEFEPKRKFDLVVAREILEHIENDSGVLSLFSGWIRGGDIY